MFFYCTEETQLLEIPDFLGDSDSCFETTFYSGSSKTEKAKVITLFWFAEENDQTHHLILLILLLCT